MVKFYSLVASLLLCVPVFGADILMEETYPPYSPIVAVLQNENNIPVHQELWKFSPELKVIFVDDTWSTVHIWAPPGRHTIRIQTLEIDWDKRVTKPITITKSFVVEGSPIPPGPDPGPEPDPGPGPTPDPVTDWPVGLRVLIMEEAQGRHELPREQIAALNSIQLRKFLSDNCAKFNNVPEYRIWDDDFDETQIKEATEIWQKLYKKALQDNKNKLPWLLAVNGKKVLSIAFPKTEAELLAELNKVK